MRRLFIIRKDLHLTAGKLAAMVGHCAEAYWMNKLKNSINWEHANCDESIRYITIAVSENEMEKYVNDIFTKTICEAKNLNDLMKVVSKAEELGLKLGEDFGFIDDCCKTELTPEFIDENGVGRVRVGVWFKPLDDEISKSLSKKYQLYKG